MNQLHTEFKVVEYYDQTKNKIWKVELQYKQDIKDQYGNMVNAGYWTTVPRERCHLIEGNP
jgi:hypothetical protein